MPTTRVRRKRVCEIVPLDETIERYFFTREKPKEDTPAWDLYVSRHFDQGAEIERVWQQHRKFLLKKWKSEGRKLKPWMK